MKTHCVYPERIPEWVSSVILVFFSISFFLPGDTVSIHGYHVLADIGFSDLILGTVIGFVALFRLLALYINGRSKGTPAVRMVGAILGAVIFISLALGFGVPMLTGEMAPNTAWGTYLVLAAWDIWATYKAGYDARFSRYR
jgi:hypothetical protein